MILRDSLVKKPKVNDMKIDETSLKTLLKALAFAAHKHKDQRRKDAEASPYINHPISLASILCNEAHITDVEVICGALLHDTVEDTDTRPEELRESRGHFPFSKPRRLQVSAHGRLRGSRGRQKSLHPAPQ